MGAEEGGGGGASASFDIVVVPSVSSVIALSAGIVITMRESPSLAAGSSTCDCLSVGIVSCGSSAATCSPSAGAEPTAKSSPPDRGREGAAAGSLVDSPSGGALPEQLHPSR